MAQTSVNFRMDAELKKTVDDICKEMGISLSTAFTIFCRKLARDRKIPFEVTAIPEDPFYSESNMRCLEKRIADIEAGRAKLFEHELNEAEP